MENENINSEQSPELEQVHNETQKSDFVQNFKNKIQGILDKRPEFHIDEKYIIGFLFILVILALGFFFYSDRGGSVSVKQYANVYSFVPEKISKSAPIQISVPNGVDEETAKKSITFVPEVKGVWKADDIEGVVVYKPQKPLQVKSYYAVHLDTDTVQVSGDFYVDEDPRIEAIFPSEGSETHEDSEITIVFNRPMVPLTTLSELEKNDLPITITPETPGKFKWISTRNLQFIPETTLIPSSDYTVKIDTGLFSLDGLPVAPLEHTFVTRPLRVESFKGGKLGYRSPFVIVFNQPVDIDKTKEMINVFQGGNDVSTEVEYGEKRYYDLEKREYVTETDLSILHVYQKRDKHGRKKFWDFETTYGILIEGAVPLSGTKNLASGQSVNFSVPNIVENTHARSERSGSVRPDLFDPQGTLEIRLYEDINKDKSKIKAKGLQNIEYGERCKTDEDGNTVYLGRSCVKEDDTSLIILSFNPEKFTTNETFNIELIKIVSAEGFEINARPIDIPVTTYPPFQILRTVPSNEAQGAALDGMFVCSNVPLKNPGDVGLSSYVEADGYIVYGRWSSSRYINHYSSYNTCMVGEFQTELNYGLHPETDYTLTLSLKDEFEQTAGQELRVKTQPPEEAYVRFHNMQKQYNVTPPDRTRLTYVTENLEYVNMHICKMEPETFLQRTVYRAERSTPPRNDGCTQIIQTRIELPKRYWVNNYFQINLAQYFTDTRGHYVITFGHPLYTAGKPPAPIYDRTYVSVTNLAVGKKEVEYYEDSYSRSTHPAKDKVLERTRLRERNIYWVSDNKTLTPVQGASVVQYEDIDESSFVARRASGVTDAEGIAQVAIQQHITGAVVRAGDDSAVVSDWADRLRWARGITDASKTYVYTDRPIYRPGHTVHIRGIDRIGFDGSYEVWDNEEVPLKLFDSTGNQIYETFLTQSAYGTFSTDYTLPFDAPLGTYRIEVFSQQFRFDVEEYVPAAFKLEAETDKEEYINGDTMRVEVQADYYFGVPLSEGTVSYSVTAQDYHFDRYTDEYFNFGGGWYFCYYCGYGDDFLFRGEEDLRDNGRAVIEREINFEDYFENIEDEKSKLVTVTVTVKDVNGRSVSLQKSFIVHKGEFYIGAKTDRYYTGKDTPVTLRAKTVNTQGEPIALSGIDRTLYKVNWETSKRQEVDGGFYYRSEKTLDEVSHKKIKTDKDGNWSESLVFPEEGQYEIHLSKEDERGNTMKVVSRVYIYGSGSVTVPPKNNYELDLEAEDTELEVGDTGTILIKSPFESAKALITIERGVVHDYWVVDVTGGLYMHEFPVKSEYAPNIYVSVMLLSGDPEVKYSHMQYSVGITEHELDVGITPNKTHYLPGEDVTLQIETKNHEGLHVPAEVSIAVADLSVLALKGNPKKSPSQFFYNGFPLSVSTASNIKNILYEVEIPQGSKGGGGMSPEDLAKKKRGVFKDTAYWEASVVTDANGKATVTFTLPDNLTTWQVEGLGVTKDTKLGVDYNEFTTRKHLMAVPLKPRFIVPGDTFSLGARIFNQTDEGRNISVSLESDTLEFMDNTEEVTFINKGESKTVYFDVTAPAHMKAGEHIFTFTASGDDFLDIVEQSIPVTKNTTHETTATAHFTREDTAREYIYIPRQVVHGEGGLTINANATMAVFLTDALYYMVTYPYGCSEQLASALSTIGILKRALSVPNVEGDFDTIEYEGVTYTVDEVVEQGLSKMYETQTHNGSFSYYKGMKGDFALTLHLVNALHELKRAGFDVQDGVIRRASAYIEREAQVAYMKYPEDSKELVVLTEYILREINGGVNTSLSYIVEGLINDRMFIQEHISSMTLAYLAVITSEGFSRSHKDTVFTALENRINIDGRGAYLTTHSNSFRRYFETPTKNTALLLKVFAARNEEHPMMANVLRWLLASRDNNGVWGNTHNTFVVIDSMVDYLEWQEESESHFSLKGLLDGIEIFGHEFNPSNVFDTFTHFIPIDSIEREKVLPLTFEKEDLNNRENNMYYDMSLKYFLPVESLPPRDEGITITRGLYELDDDREENQLKEVEVGDVIKGKLSLTAPDAYSHVAIEDIIPAGFEIVNFNLETEDKTLQERTIKGSKQGKKLASLMSRLTGLFGKSQIANVYRDRGYYGGSYGNRTRTLNPTHTESHDDRIFLYVENLPEGVYEYEYYLRALVPGEFQHLPARAEELFFPEVFGRTSGDIIEVTPSE